MKKAIIITSIFDPTEAIGNFSRKEGFQLYVVGDKKTPQDWHIQGVEFISLVDQEKMNFRLSKVLPYNHYCRKMLGYLEAIKTGVELIIDTDDDNIPKDSWNFPEFEEIFECIGEHQGFVNIYQLFTDEYIWPRGLPLNMIHKNFHLESSLSNRVCNVGVWQGLADKAPDVDAIYCLTNHLPVYFKERKPVVLGKGTLCPFNTQNTAIVKELFPLLYLPTFVSFRFTDVLRGLIAQPIMWLYDYQLGFTFATVVHQRNPHDFMNDFKSEIPMYLHVENVAEIVSKVVSGNESIETNLHNAYHALLEPGIVSSQEMITLEAWLSDLDMIKLAK